MAMPDLAYYQGMNYIVVYIYYTLEDELKTF